MVDREEVTRPGEEATASEEPTFFGLDAGPLFGVLHLPADGQIRGGVLICGSLGKEGMDSTRFQRVVAGTLARRGFAVLRFDYLGTGDSAYLQGRRDAIADWLSSIGQAIDFLASIGAQSITGLGIRAGALLLNNYLGVRPGSLANVVYLDPVSTGRRYLREHTTMYRLAVGDDATLFSDTLIIGARINESAVAEFGALRFDTSRRPVEHTLVIGRAGEPDAGHSVSAEGVESSSAEGFPEFAQSAGVMVPMPLAAGDLAVDWIDSKVSELRTIATPKYERSVEMPIDGPGSLSVEERIERIGEKNLFAIRTLPADGVPATGKAVLFFMTANDSHHGPGREWVELSRRLATSGSQAVRWDRAGLGADGRITRDQWQTVYATADIADAIEVAGHASTDPKKLELVGVCSGSWYAAQAARVIGAGHVVMINQVMWGWHVFTTWPWQWRLRKSLLAASTSSGHPAQDAEHLRKRLIALSKPMRIRIGEVSSRWMPRWLRLALGSIGLQHVPEVVLSALAGRGTEVTVVASPWDAEQFRLKGGFDAIDRLSRTRLVQTDVGDHAGYHPAILAAVRDVVLRQQLPSGRPIA